MNSPTLAYAYLSAAYNSAGNVSSPLDTLKPLIKRAFLKRPREALDRESVYSRIQELFGIDVPLNVISYLLASMVNKDKFLSKRIEGKNTNISNAKYIVSDFKEMTEFDELDKRAREIWSDAIAHVQTTMAHHENDFGSPSEVLEDWLDNSSIGFVGGGGKGYAFNKIDQRLNQFMQHCLNLDESGDFLENITELAVGDVIYRSIKSVTEYEVEYAEAHNRRMSDVKVFFDTRFILHLLGCNGEEFERSAKETISLAVQTSCQLRIFEHTLEEIQRIIQTVAGKMNVGVEADGSILAYAFENHLAASDLLEFASEIEDKLEAFKIYIEMYPDVDEEYQLSIQESALDHQLEQDLRQKNPAARKRDINSLTGIFRLRKGKPFKFLEDSKAILISTNKGLVDSATSFFQQQFREENKTNTVQICMTDVVFSTRLWTKLPTNARKLPKAQIVVHILGNLKPSETLKTEFVNKLQSLIDDGSFSEKSLAVVKLSRFTDRMLATDFAVGTEELSRSIVAKKTNEIIQNFRDFVQETKGRSNPDDVKKIEELELELADLKAIQTSSVVVDAELELNKEKNRIVESIGRRENASLRIRNIARLVGALCVFIVMTILLGMSLGYIVEESQTAHFLNLLLSTLTAFGLSFMGATDWIGQKLVNLFYGR